MERVLIMKRTDMSDLEGLVYIFKTTDYNMDIIQCHLKKKTLGEEGKDHLQVRGERVRQA